MCSNLLCHTENRKLEVVAASQIIKSIIKENEHEKKMRKEEFRCSKRFPLLPRIFSIQKSVMV